MTDTQVNPKHTQYVTSKDGTQIAYDVMGSGPVLIYITGASCFRKFPPVLEDVKVFSKDFTVYNFDRRGRGDSSDTQPYSVEKEIEDIEALIEVSSGKALLYGHSSGAVLALEAAYKLKNVEKIIVYDVPYVATETEKSTYKALSDKVLTQLSLRNNKKAMKTFLSGIGMPKLFVWLLPFFPGWEIMHQLAPTLAYDIDLTKNFAPLDRLKDIEIPTLVLAGSKSPENIRVVARQIAKAIPMANYEEIDGQDHMVSAKVLLPIFNKFFGKEMI